MATEHLPKGHLDFAPEDLPWLDAPARRIDDYIESHRAELEDPEGLRYRLINWQNFGYAVFPGVIEPELIDAVLADMDEILARHEEFSTMVDSTRPDLKFLKLKEVPPEIIEDYRNDRGSVHLRLMNFIHNSAAAKQLSVHPRITGFLEHVLQDRVVAFQSLTFFQGSEQSIHQDYGYVETPPRAKLVASWVALEDIHPDSGPLTYVPGSHRLRKFDFGKGLYLGQGDLTPDDFCAHIEREIDKAGLPRFTFCPKKGDVFLWHGALAHGGSPVRNPALTRKSYVTHYGVASKHKTHVHGGNKPAERIELPGGVVFRHPLYPDEEDKLGSGTAG